MAIDLPVTPSRQPAPHTKFLTLPLAAALWNFLLFDGMVGVPFQIFLRSTVAA